MDLREKQLQYELENDAEAAAQRLMQLQQEVAEGKVETPHTSRFIARAFALVQAEIEKELSKTHTGVAAKFRQWLRVLPPEVSAVLALREVIRCCMSPRLPVVTIADLCEPLGRLLYLEAQIAQAAAVNPLYVQRVQEQIEERRTTSTRHVRGVYGKVYETVLKRPLENLTRTEYIQLGKLGVQACISAGIVEYEHTRGSRGTLVVYRLVPEVLRYLTTYDARDVFRVVHTDAMLMQCPPDPWDGLKGGGYCSSKRKELYRLIRMSEGVAEAHAMLREAATPEHMPAVFEVANYLQSTPMTLHAPTRDAILRVWQSGGGVLGVPSKHEPKKPPFPFSDDWVKAEASPQEREVFQDWCDRAALHYDELRKWRGRVRDIGAFFRSTKVELERFWSPVYADWRGRWYYAAQPNPQGTDLAKAVLHFADKRALGPEGVFWLKVHIANSLGFDKKRFVARAAWTDQHWEALERALDAPEDYPEVWGQDNPWCAFSAAWELREAYRSGNPATYRTGIPVHMDATCSGLQHFSAVLRDPVGGRYVNLTDDGGEEKSDIYRHVADVALDLIRQDTNPEHAAMAKFWLERGVTRDKAKRPVMTYVYGATHITLTRYVASLMMDEPLPEGLRLFPLCSYLATKLLESIELTVPAAAEAMRWLRDVARRHARDEVMSWTAPSGMKVVQAYPEYREVRVDLRSCGVTKIRIRVPSGRINPRNMQNGMAPNFVHSLDASHLCLTAQQMQREGLALMAIHDSFGTHPSEVSAMHRIIREQFVQMYDGKTILQDFLWDIGGTGEIPKLGTLDLTHTYRSEFFFS